MNNSRQDNHSSGQESNSGPSVREAGVLNIEK